MYVHVCLYVFVQKTGPFAVCRLGLAIQYFSTAVLRDSYSSKVVYKVSRLFCGVLWP